MKLTEAQINVIIGGVIGILPSILLYLSNLRLERSRQSHELRLKRIDLVESERLRALREYAELCGQFCIGELTLNTSTKKFISTHNNAMLYVSTETLHAMNLALPIILSSWNDVHDNRKQSWNEVPEINVLVDCLRREMQLCALEIGKPQRKGIHVKRKRR